MLLPSDNPESTNYANLFSVLRGQDNHIYFFVIKYDTIILKFYLNEYVCFRKKIFELKFFYKHEMF